MHTLSAFCGNVANNVTDTVLPAIADNTINVIDSRYQFQQTRKLLRSFAAVPDGTAVRLSSPSYNRGLQPVIDPIDADATPGGDLPAVCDYNGKGLDIPRLENFGPLVTRAGAGAADCFVLLWHTQQFRPAPAGDVYTIRGTGNATGASLGWRLGSITFDQALPNGTYDVVGMRITGANCLAARLVFPSSSDRPGVLANVAPTAWIYPSFRFGSGGLFGTFNNTNIPQIEVIGTGAVAAQVLTLDLIPRNFNPVP